MTSKIKQRYFSIFLSIFYSIILFGPHRLFGFNYIQEVCLILLSLFHLKSGVFSRKFLISLTLFSCYCILKFSQVVYIGSFDSLFLLSFLKILISFSAVDFLMRERYTSRKDIFFSLLIFNLLNSLSIVLQFFVPYLRDIFFNNFQEIRFSGFAWDGFQVTTLISSVLILILIEKIFDIENKKLIDSFLISFSFFIYCLVVLTSWIFQGRLSQLIGLSIILFFLLFKIFKFKKNKLSISVSSIKFTGSLFFLITLIISFLTIFFNTFFVELISSSEVRYGLQIYNEGFFNLQSYQDIRLNKLSINDYFSAPNEWFFGTVSSGRAPLGQFNSKRVLFDNGYYLDIYSYGLIGSALIYYLSLNLLKSIGKFSKFFYLLLFLFLICHIKEATFLSGSSYFALALLAKFEE